MKISYKMPDTRVIVLQALSVLCESRIIGNTIYFVDMQEDNYSDLWED